MSLNKVSGNMYEFIDGTSNTVKGICPHGCSYCYIKRIADRYSHGVQQPLHLDEKKLKTSLGSGKFIFIGSSCDMFADSVHDDWIIATLCWANMFENKYLLQTKNPARFMNFLWLMKPSKYLLCTTIETNLFFPEIMRGSPPPEIRSNDMAKLPKDYRRMVTIEPIMKFSLKELSYHVLCCQPEQVNIGADTGRNNLPEPSPKEIRELIRVLSQYTKVVLKKNLDRLMKE
jgi:DNA repair photolyase